MMKKEILYCLLFFVNPVMLMAQVMVKSFDDVHYSIAVDTTNGTTELILKIENQSESTLSTSPFSINQNKIIVHNAKDEKVGYDMIVCGTFSPTVVPNDSTRFWRQNALEALPIMNGFIVRPKSIKNLDSLYLLYWRINKHKIGPIKYYPEKDLIARLSHPKTFVRDQAATNLCGLMEQNLNRIAPGNMVEHPAGYWADKLAQLYEGMPMKEAKAIFSIDSLTDRILRARGALWQLDNAMGLVLEYQGGALDVLAAFKLRPNPRVIKNNFPKPQNGVLTIYHINGTLREKSFYAKGQKTLSQHYDSEGILFLENAYAEKVVRKFDREGNIISERKRKKRSYD